jgi:Zn-dependent M28 family amino/carboxypeptidase
MLIVSGLLASDRTHGQASPATPEATATPDPTTFSGARAFEHVAAQVAFGIRPTGSDALIKAGNYIVAKLKAYGWKVTEQPFDLQINGSTIRGRNITGSLGSGPVIIIGGHYDTRLWADHDPDPARQRDPVMGANDAGSDVGIELEIARLLAEHYTLQREIRLAFFDAEDNGNIPGWNDWSLGTSYYAQNLDVKPEYVIILDMLGGTDLKVYYETNSMQSAPEIMTKVWEVAADLGYGDNFVPTAKYAISDDHIPFITRGIKAIDLIDFDYKYWHTIGDTLDKISATSLEKAGRVVIAYLERAGVISPKS